MPSDRVQRHIDRLLDEADQAIAAQDWATVLVRSAHVLTLDPENSDALSFQAVAERGLGGAGGTPGGGAGTQETRPATPAFFSNGRYAVQRFLGEGGKKQVYLAHDLVLDRDVAFALIKSQGLDGDSLARVRREAQAMGRLGDHPNIVPVYDMGEEPSTRQPYIVTQLLTGGDVEGLLERAEDHRLPLDNVVRITREVCLGLEYAHGHGIVHRDLKPGNVWLTADGTAKIGDFGLAVALGRSRLTDAGTMVGTVAYMPPEQALGADVAPRSDLYSLGCMLYEMVTGRPPFLGDDSVAIIGQHINTAPVAPSWHNPQCVRPLEALIERLLAKDPGDRPASAADVRVALEAIDLQPGAGEATALEEDGRILDSLAGGVFVGRQRELGELKAALEDALSGRGRLLALVGEPGIGKTRLSLELSTYAGLRQAQVVWGRCYEALGAPPYWPWVQAIRSYIQDRDEQQLRSEMGAGIADIAEVVSELRERLPDIKPAPSLEPEQARFRLFDSIASSLKNAARRRPLVLILEDLHWADRSSLLLLEFLASELAGSRILVIGTYRDVEVSRHHPLSLTLAELAREQLFQRIALRGLAAADIARFIELAAGVLPAPELVEAVYRQTEGNPLFVTEVVRLLVQEGHLGQATGQTEPQTPGSEPGPARQGDAGSVRDSDTWMVRIPEGVREVIGRRLDRLSERCNQVLTIASVVGREFTLDQLERLVEDTPRLRLLDVLEEALAARIVEELPRAAGRYQFTHALIQETLTEELSTTRRVHLHAQIAEALEALYGQDAGTHAAELAYHYAEAATVTGTEKLVRYSLLAGEQALSGHAYEEALAVFQRALAARGDGVGGRPGPATRQESVADTETAGLLFGLGRAQMATLPIHQITEAVATMRRAFAYFAAAGDVERAAAIADYPPPIASGIVTGAVELVTEALTLVPRDSLEAGRLFSLQGRLLGLEHANLAAAREAVGRALEIARRLEDPALEIRARVDAVEVEGYDLDWPRTMEHALRAIELAPRADDPQAETVANYWVVLLRTLEGDLPQAAKHAAAVLAAAERLRHHFYLSRALFLNAMLAVLQGKWTSAREYLDRALAVSPREVRALVLRAALEFQVGEYEAGETYLERVLEVVRETPSGPTFAHAFTAVLLGSIGWTTGSRDRSARAEEVAGIVLESPSATPLNALWSRHALALAAVQEEDSALAGAQYAQLQKVTGAAVSMWAGCFDDHYILGLLARAIGEPEAAIAHLEDCIVFCRKAGYLPFLAWACVDCAHTLLRLDSSRDRGARTDHAKAAALLDEGLRLARELGMRPLLERALRDKDLLSA